MVIGVMTGFLLGSWDGRLYSSSEVDGMENGCREISKNSTCYYPGAQLQETGFLAKKKIKITLPMYRKAQMLVSWTQGGAKANQASFPKRRKREDSVCD